jgi:putative RNA 2'-phosphotransferase
MSNKNISKFLSLVLRHEPKKINIQLDENGWVDVDELIIKMNQHKMQLDFKLLEEVVVTNDKQRFSFNEDLTKIRANQGHSIEIDLALDSAEPPANLYHGTVEKFIESIRQTGLQKMSRQHVHLSKIIETAEKVGSRRGKPVILTIATGEMFRDGYLFYLSKNGVWLCNDVPAKYIKF